MTKIDVISGFLGAGKTTFIKKLIGEALAGEKVVLIENEFGEIAIDGGFLKDAGIEIREMSQGCICCSLVGDFEKALREVIDRFAPERVIIEPSGVGKLSDVMKAVTDASADLDVVLNSAVTVVDAKKCRMYMKNFGEFFNNQVQYAGTVVLSRTDVVNQDVIDECVELIRGLNPAAEIITTPTASLPGSRLLEIIEKRDDMLEQMRKEALSEPDGESEEEHEAHHHHHHHHHHEEKEHGEGTPHYHFDGNEDDDDDSEHEIHHYHYDAGEDADDEEALLNYHHRHHHDEEDDEDEDECEHEHGHHEHGHHEHEHHEHHEHGHDDDHDHEHHHHHHGHDADEIFESYGWTNVPPISEEMLNAVLEHLCIKRDGQILRCKGMLQADDCKAWYYFDMVPGEYQIRKGAPDYTGKVCVIGSGLKEEELKNLFFRNVGGTD